MKSEFTASSAKPGERLNISNVRSVPVKAIISGFACGTIIEIGLSAGQFFTVVGGSSALSVEFRDIVASELQHPGTISSDVLPNEMH